ncbi:hypothetical protein RKD49_002444 [Streptomyces glaucescens]|jgi:hypothetical protein
MRRAPRESLGPDRLVLTVQGRSGPPPLRLEWAHDGRRALHQGERPLWLGRTIGEGCCRDLVLHRLDGYRSPLPPLRADLQRARRSWAHPYADWLEDAPESPLHDGRWQLARRGFFEPTVWTEDFVRDWPGARLELLCGGGWHGVLPLRRLSPPDAPRVRAYRKHAREGTLAPVLLWWVAFLDGWLLLDGHDRAVAALAEGSVPQCVELTRVPDEEEWRRTVDDITEGHRRHLRELAARPAGPGTDRQRAAVERGYADAVAELPYDPATTRTWPLPGGVAAWDDLAARTMFQFPGD